MSRDEIFDAIDGITEELFKSKKGNVTIVHVEIALAKKGFHIGKDIHRKSFVALVESKIQFLKNEHHH